MSVQKLPRSVFPGETEALSVCPGRIRVRYPALYRSSGVKQKIEKGLSGDPAVVQVRASPLTANVLILFDESVTPPRMLARLGVPHPAGLKAKRMQAHKWGNRTDHAAQPEGERASGLAAGQIPWYLLEEEDVLSRLGANRVSGLDQATAERKLAWGRNLLPRRPPPSAFILFLNQLKGVPVLLLGASAVLSLLTGGIAEAAAIAAVLGMNATIGFVTERRTEATIAALSHVTDRDVPVLRNGKAASVSVSDIVPGDLLLLSPGVQVAADARLLDASTLSVDESMLTGESRFIAKHPGRCVSAQPLAARTNMVHRARKSQ